MASGVMGEAREQRWVSYGLLLVALWLTLMLLVIKVWIGWATHSLSLISGAVHTLVTGFSLLLSVIALATPYWPHRELWGHGRLESSLTLLMVGFLGFASCNLLAMLGREVAGQLTHSTAHSMAHSAAHSMAPGTAAGTAPAMTAEMISAMAPGITDSTASAGYSIADWAAHVPFSIDLAVFQVLGGITAIAFCLGMMGRYQAKLVNNATLGFSFTQSLVDAGVMGAILLGWVGMAAGWGWLDWVLTGVVIILVLFNSYRLLNRQLPALIRQVAIAPEALTRSVRQVEGILHCYGIQSRGLVGRQIYVEMHLILHPECLTVAPTIIERVERVIRQQYGSAQVVVHVDSDRLSKPQ